MSIIDIVEVCYYQDEQHQLWGYAIDAPVAGTQYNSHILEIRGWVLGKTAPAVFAILMNQYEQEALKRTPIQSARPDVAAHYRHVPQATHSGFIMTFSVLGLPLETTLHLLVRLKGQQRLRLATIRLQRQKTLLSPYSAQLQPLMITSLPRSGSTWLMHLLAHHPEIIAYRHYPYENYAAKYWLYNMLKVFAEPGHYLNRDNRDELFNLNLDWIQYHCYQNSPFNTWFGEEYLAQLVGFCQHSIDQFYQQVAQEQQFIQGRYFAEKFGPGYVTGLFHELYPQAREIILVRDFRDVLCSMLAFTQKIGHAGFGLEHLEQDEAIFAQIQLRAQSLVHYWQLRTQQALLIRYEDLLLKPQVTLKQILHYLELDSQVVEHMLNSATQDTQELQAHRTSQQPKASINRWHRDMNAALKQLCHSQLHVELSTFDYELS